MRIGYVLKQFPKLSETFVLNEILALEAEGHEITVFSLTVPHESRIHGAVGRLQGEILQLGCGRTSEVAQRLAASRTLFHKTSSSDAQPIFDLLSRPGRDPFRYLRQALELVLAAKDLGIEHLHAHFAGPASDVAQVGARLLRISSSFTCHAKDIYHEDVDRITLAARIDAADAVVTVCEANRQYLEDRIQGHVIDHLHMLYNGIDTTRFHPAQREHSESPLLLGVGRLVEKKGFANLVRALQKLEDRGLRPRCVIAGEGRERPTLEAMSRELGVEDRLEFLGAVDQGVVQSLLQQATLLVQPCVIGEDGNQDALPTVILEAMAAGVPVVSTPVGGIEEMLGPGSCGTLVPQRDPTALADAIATLLADESQRLVISRAARARVEQHFHLAANVRRLASIFDECVSPQKARVAS